MYAVIKTGGKQYRVAEGELLTVERLPGEPGESVALDEVLMVGEGESAAVGSPTVAGASVAAEIVEQSRGEKVIVFKKKRRKGYRRRKGHRQDQTVLRIMEILTDGKKPSGKKAAKPKPQKVEAKAEAEPKPEETEAEAPEAEETAGVAPETFSAPQGEADDLKQIGGLGPKLEEKLNALGIYHFHQIAGLTPENVAWLDEQLGSKGRVERDDWIAQAAELAEAAKSEE